MEPVNQRLSFLILLVLLSAGCIRIGELPLADSIKVADGHFAEQRYGAAAAAYRQLLDKCPEGPTRERLFIQRGRCFYNDQIQSLHDAQQVFQEYLERYPEGIYRAEVEAELNKIRAIIANRDRATTEYRQNLKDDVDALETAIETYPYDADLRVRLGHALWDLGRYDEACRAYLRGQEINAALKEYDLIVKRMVVDEWGNVIPITPDKQRQLKIESNPLVVFDLNEYRSRPKRNVLGVEEAWYNLIGKIRNQGSRTLSDVVIEVAFLNPVGRPLDVQRYYVGKVAPGAIRVFRVQAKNYDNIYNITGYEYQIFYSAP